MAFSQERLKAIIIGSGISGLACAARLRAKGYDVTVYEAQSTPGGKLAELSKDGYRFDIGPSLFTEPEFLEQLFKDCGYELSSFLKYQRLPVIAKYFYSDGVVLTAWAGKERFIQEAIIKTGELEKHIIQFFKRNKSLYEDSKKSLSYAGSKRTPFSLLKQYSPLGRNVHAANEKMLKNRKMQQLFDIYATYSGSNPYKAPDILNALAYVEHELGVYYPVGGTRRIIDALMALCHKMGVHIECNTPVESIIANTAVEGVMVNGASVKADIVVSNSDVYNTYSKLLKHLNIPEKQYNYPPSTSMIMFCWGMKKSFPQLDVHNVFLSRFAHEEYEAIYEDKTLFQDLTARLHITSKLYAADAPKDCENWVVTVNVPHDSGQDWNALAKQARDIVLGKLHMLVKDDIQSFITCEEIITPPDFQSRTGAWHGALYGPDSNSLGTIANRQTNASKDIPNLYFCGGTVYPGAGIPGCLQSAKIVADMVS